MDCRKPYRRNNVRYFIERFQSMVKLGVFNYFKYKLAKNGDCVLLKLNCHLVYVRKGTPDLEVAISCLIDGEFSQISRYLDKSFQGVIVDAGGYIGTAALALSEMFPQAHIVTIEPSVENINILKKNVSSNANIRFVYGALVGRDIGSVSLRNRGTGEWGFTAVENPLDNKEAKVIQETPAFTISMLGVDLDNLGVLKLDIEGGEFEIFTYDIETLKKAKVVVAELHDRIVMGCSEAFKQFSIDRDIINGDGEKYFSIRRY